MTTTDVTDEREQFPRSEVWPELRAVTGDGGARSEEAEDVVDREGDQEGRGSASAIIHVGVALVTVAALLVAFFAYVFVFSSITAARNQQRLTASLIGHPLTVTSLVDGRRPSEGSAIAVLDIPTLHLHQVVVEGTSAADLLKGPGLMPGTVLPGTAGNAVIAGRRVTFGSPFRSIDTLKRGQTIKVVDGAGTFTYRVDHVTTVPSGHRDVVGPTASNRLTLITADAGLLTSGRLVVVAKLKGAAASVDAVTGRIPPRADLALNGDPASGWLTPLWMLITVGVVVAAAAAARRWRQPWLVYLLAAPIVLMCGLFACQALARALPATF
jgi:sortase A